VHGNQTSSIPYHSDFKSLFRLDCKRFASLTSENNTFRYNLPNFSVF
jgi:hypothetical protein